MRSAAPLLFYQTSSTDASGAKITSLVLDSGMETAVVVLCLFHRDHGDLVGRRVREREDRFLFTYNLKLQRKRVECAIMLKAAAADEE